MMTAWTMCLIQSLDSGMIIMDISPDANLDELFRPLDNSIIDKDSFDDYMKEL